jgi:hypothetical protein
MRVFRAVDKQGPTVDSLLITFQAIYCAQIVLVPPNLSNDFFL